jgi:asparagine synthase (glutamine-hydrolysing)
MCGICGIIRFDNQSVQEAPIRKMMHIMKHRGPDNEGVFLENNIALGFVRLSIIDLSEEGNQPMISKDNRHVIVFNGEIYNYIELKEELQKKGYSFHTKTDTEVLLNSYLEWGPDCLHRFNGMWAFVIYDRLRKSIFAARDRFGVKPFYYYYNNKTFIFSSEIPPILKVMPDSPKENEDAIFNYLVYNRTDYYSTTFFEKVYRLEKGHNVSINLDSSSFHFKRWYNLSDNLKTPVQSKEEFLNLFQSSISLRLRSDVPVGVCLSGGLDSSSILSMIIQKFGRTDINTFSSVYGSSYKEDELNYINCYRETLPNMNLIYPNANDLLKDLEDFVSVHGEPVPTASPYAGYKVMQSAKGKSVVLLNGQGADEYLAGYHYFFGFNFLEMLRNLNLVMFLSEAGYYVKKHHSLFGFYTMVYFMLPALFQKQIKEISKNYLDKDFSERHRLDIGIPDIIYKSRSLKESFLRHFEYKLEHLLKWEDRNSMASSIEARVPFLDYRLVEATINMSHDKIIHKGETKFILRESMKGILPEKIRTRTDKIGFDTPMASWFKEPAFIYFIENIIQSPDFKNRGYFNTSKINEEFEANKSSGKLMSTEIWKWINLELWFRRFIDRH